MTRPRFTYLKLIAVGAVLAAALIPSTRPSTAKNETLPAAEAAPGADLTNEARVISKYADDLVRFDKQIEDTGKRARLVEADFDPLQRRSDELKGRLSQIQDAARETIRKLKAAGEWDDADTIPTGITDRGLRSILQERSFKQELEAASNGLTSHASEISTPLENLRKKLTSRYRADDVKFVSASYEVPAAFGFVSVRCSIQTVKTNIFVRTKLLPTSQTIMETWAACHPGQPYPF